MQGEALLKIGGILEKLSNDITILKNNSIGISGGNPATNRLSNGSLKQSKQFKPRSKSNSSNSNKKKPILRSTSQKRRAANKPTKRGSLKKKQVKRKSSNKKNNKRR